MRRKQTPTKNNASAHVHEEDADSMKHKQTPAEDHAFVCVHDDADGTTMKRKQTPAQDNVFVCVRGFLESLGYTEDDVWLFEDALYSKDNHNTQQICLKTETGKNESGIEILRPGESMGRVLVSRVS
jgi:hypothetical protein